MIILGAGMAGCLAGIMNGGAKILEAAPSLPNNHHGVLRFRSDNISKITGIPFKRVVVRKALWFDGYDYNNATPRLANMYSQKVIGKIQERSIMNLAPAERWIAPEYFHKLLGEMLEDRIEYNCKVMEITERRVNMEIGIHSWSRGEGDPIISTIPMTAMARCTGLPFPDNYDCAVVNNIYVSKVRISRANVHQTIYYPDPNMNIYRASIVGDLLIIEAMDSTLKSWEQEVIRESFGLSSPLSFGPFTSEQGKIAPIDDSARKNFMLRLSMDFNIWSLGRYACWRPSVLLDDVYDDILKIRSMMGTHNYDIRRNTL